MSHGPEFFQTIMGRKFYDSDVPSILRALERIASALERNGEHMAAREREDIAATAAFVMREACAEEADKLYGEQAAAQIRAVPLPHEGTPDGAP